MKNYIIYDHPKDYPNSYVMRVFEITANGATPTLEVAVSTNLEKVRDSIPAECVCIGRDPDDDPVILETWI